MAPCLLQLRLRRVWVECLAACGLEAVAVALCAAAVRAAQRGPLLQMQTLLQTGGGLCEGRAKTARDLLEALAQARGLYMGYCNHPLTRRGRTSHLFTHRGCSVLALALLR